MSDIVQERTNTMFAVIIIAVVAAIIISRITVEVNNVISSNTEIVMTSNLKSISEVVKAVKDWTTVDTSVEETSAEAINVIFTKNGNWKMVRVEGRAVKFSGRCNNEFAKASGWMFINTVTGASDMLLEVNGKSSAWEARNWFGTGNFAVNTKVAVK
jgi:hypothetical protein